MKIDLHLDTLWRMTKYGYFNINKGSDYSMISTERLKSAGLDTGIFALYLPRELEYNSEASLNAQIDFAKAQNIRDFKILLALEGGRLLGNNKQMVLQRLNFFADIGIVYLTLTHNYNTFWADSATDKLEHNGITDFGIEVIKTCNRLGILIDISHAATSTANAVLDVSVAPVIASHSGCKALIDHPRNIDDHLIKRIAASKGIIGIPFVKKFVGSLEGVANNIDHITQIVGWEYIAIGSDIDGALMIDGIDNIGDYDKVSNILIHRGFTEEAINGITGNNFKNLLDRM